MPMTDCLLPIYSLDPLMLDDLQHANDDAQGQPSAQFHSVGSYFMQKDLTFFKELQGDGQGKVHFYRWHQLELSLGCFSDESHWLHPLCPSVFKKTRIARRPTGGGVMVHGRDLCFSLFIPKCHRFYNKDSSQLYVFWHQRLVHLLNTFLKQHHVALFGKKSAVAKVTLVDKECCSPELSGALSTKRHHQQGACFAKLSQYDAVINGKKILGSAIRRSRYGIMHQFCLQLGLFPETELSHYLSAEGCKQVCAVNTGLLVPPQHLERNPQVISDIWYKRLVNDILTSLEAAF